MMPAVKANSGILLSVLLDNIVDVAMEDDREIASIQIDSRLVGEGDLFVAMPGTVKHGLSYLAAVVEIGASCVMFDKEAEVEFAELLKKYQEQIVLIKVDSVLDAVGVVIDRFYGRPSSQMQVIGITGTDGKTSVSRFIAQVMNDDMKSAVIGTTGNGLWGDIREATHTTPDVLSLHKIMADLKDHKAALVSMEVSSHGIDQQRISGVDIDTAVLTNVSRDHLDYHGNEENYRQVKKQLFRQKSVQNVVLNLDDSTGEELLKELASEKNVWGYSLTNSSHGLENSVYVESLEVKGDGYAVVVVTPAGKSDLYVPLLGRFNVSNILATLCVMLINNIELKTVVERIARLETAPGRMELFSAKKKPSIVVDYAHTPKALEMALLAVSEHCAGKLWCVFGCGGDRDVGKRPLMGTVAESLSDFVVLTNDNPRSEKSSEIIDQILSGFNSQKNVEVIADRSEAIQYACEHAVAGDVILLAGKGHEEFQIINGKKIPFSDRKEVLKCLGGLH